MFLFVLPWFFAMSWLNDHVARTISAHAPKNAPRGPATSFRAAVSLHLVAVVTLAISRRPEFQDLGEGDLTVADVAFYLGYALIACSGFLLIMSRSLGRLLAAALENVASHRQDYSSEESDPLEGT
jgi:hypothetical protein